MSSNDDNSSKKCGLVKCGAVQSKFLCAGCNVVHYCSAAHQKSDWKKHKKVCCPLTLQTSEELGQHYVASWNLKAGTLIVSEMPLWVEPMILLDPDDSNQIPKNVCIACCRSTANDKKCPKCDWPICSIECSKAKIHAENECPIFIKYSMKFDKTTEANIGVFIIRSMFLKKSKPELWDKIFHPQFGKMNKTLDPSKEKSIEILAKNLQDRLVEHTKLDKELDQDFFKTSEIIKLLGVQMLNSISFYYCSKEGNKETAATNLYLKSSNFVHACFPNCFWTANHGPDFKLEIRTSIDIGKGQILSIPYHESEFVIGAVQYNINELKRGNFNCLCARCLDPTELNSMMSAVKCTKGDCTDGHLIPKDSKNMSPSNSSIWECNKCLDQSTDTWKGIKMLVKRAENMTKKFTNFEPKKIEDMLIILRKHLHPNHWVIQQFCYERVLKELEEKAKSGQAKNDILDYYIETVKYLLQVFQVTMPGLNFFKSEVQFKLFLAIEGKFCRSETTDQKIELAKYAHELLDDLLKIKQFDSRYQIENIWKPIMLDLILKQEKMKVFLEENC